MSMLFKSRYLLLMAFVITSFSLSAQVLMSGTVRDFENKKPIDSAHIQIELFEKRKVIIDAFTDKQGHYEINIPFPVPVGNYPVNITKPGIYDMNGFVKVEDGAVRDFTMRYRVIAPSVPFSTPVKEQPTEEKKDTPAVVAEPVEAEVVPEPRETPPVAAIPVVVTVPVAEVVATLPVVPEKDTIPAVESMPALVDTVKAVSVSESSAQAEIAPIQESSVQVAPVPVPIPEPVAEVIPVVPVIMPIKEGAVVQVNNIYFNANSIYLKPASHGELDKIAEFLKSTPNIKVEIGGHTNSFCDDDFCLYLSNGRAKAVKDYLISRGVPATMITHKGYGKQFPISNDNSLNQRVEMKIVEVN